MFSESITFPDLLQTVLVILAGASFWLWRLSERRAGQLDQMNRQLNQNAARLAEKRRSLNLALKASQAGFYSLDFMERRAECDERAYTVYGRSPDAFDATLDNIMGVVIPEDRVMLDRFRQLLQSDATDWHDSYHVITADNDIRCIEAFGYIVREPGNTPVKMIGTVADITGRKQTEAALRESENRLRIITDSAPTLIWLSDTDNLGVWYNQRWLNYTGRSLEQ